jgi:hypothetical protein
MPDAVGPTKLPKKKLDDHIPERQKASLYLMIYDNFSKNISY